ncbi:MarR family winged helix-turn-helix transcriptional regulator [Embleya scabrispora]|jgi:MarR family transcriptional regulator, lower aerobic nicotinate degradation pathway regulator|uniref:MarR family winged helix-turn-helix transcriptional regulator n=1 Tax=Embleya scabrispora TaxID=159449 RepID=UPI00035E389A|nr:MarR family transcriptional regulator [Embleya scabrispora]MYS85495.1 MarR family transcriptional regulator [Streptomyces sp. SID5474]
MVDKLPAPARIRVLPSWLLGRAAAHGRGLVRRVLAADGMPMLHHLVLIAVREYGPVAQAELARAVAVDPKDMVAILNSLQADGLVTRTPDPRDRRKNAITTTPAGEQRLARQEPLVDAAMAELLAPLDPTEQATFMALLTRVAAAGEPTVS